MTTPTRPLNQQSSMLEKSSSKITNQGKIIYDNTGTKYLEIVSVEVKPSLVSSPDQFRILRVSADPFSKDVFIVANVFMQKQRTLLKHTMDRS